MKIKLFILLIIFSNNVFSQDTHFLDSLFLLDFSQVAHVNSEIQKTEMKRLKSDWGLTAGVNITNSIQDEIDAGLSTRVFAKVNVLSNGFYSNRVDADIIKNTMVIDSLSGIDRAVDHNYGIYYDYIISQYNKEKISIIDSILISAEKIRDYYSTLYYNKLLDYEKILQISSTIEQFYTLQQSQLDYNQVVANMNLDAILPDIYLEGFQIDFQGVLQKVSLDTAFNRIVLLKDEIIELRHEKEKAPSLSIAGGYDISRNRPYYSVGFSARITRNKNAHIVAHKDKHRNDMRLVNLQRKKELINLQYEYQYKNKQIKALYLKLEIIKEQKRKYSVKKDVLSLEESAQEKKIDLENHLIEYEIMDLKQQQMLLLLKFKKQIRTIKIAPYLKAVTPQSSPSKFIGKRYVVINENSTLNRVDIHILRQNEIKPLLPKELIELQNVMPVDPSKYRTRADMEYAIQTLVNNQSDCNLVIKSIDSLKELELRTLEQKDFHLTAYIK